MYDICSIRAKQFEQYTIYHVCPKDTSTGLEGLFNFQVHEAEEMG
jgi:hypothetical protein